jgi:hypothetical protein
LAAIISCQLEYAVFDVESDDGLVFVLGSGIVVSLKDPDHESAFPMKRYAFVEKAVETAVLEVAVPPIF